MSNEGSGLELVTVLGFLLVFLIDHFPVYLIMQPLLLSFFPCSQNLLEGLLAETGKAKAHEKEGKRPKGEN